MSQPDTRERLIDAAQALFSEQGFLAASLRAITERAGANLAAVSYHFGGKEGLLEAVVERVAGVVNAERLRRFDLIEASPGGGDLEAWVRALVEPCFTCVDPKSFAAFFGLMARVHLEAPEQIAPIFERRFRVILERFLPALRRLLPKQDRERLHLRLLFAGGAFGKCMMLFGHHQTPPLLPIPVPTPEVASEELVAFTLAGLSASGGR